MKEFKIADLRFQIDTRFAERLSISDFYFV